MELEQTKSFEKSFKKYHKKEQISIENAIKEILSNPRIGELKVRDLAEVRVHKFKINNLVTLLSYLYNPDKIILLSVGTHQDFYNDLNKIMN